MPKKLALIPMKKRIAEIRAVYERAAARIIAPLSSLDPATYMPSESGRIMREIKFIVATLDTSVRMWAPNAIRAAYEESADVARTRLEMIGAKKLPERRYNPMRHEKKIELLTRTIMRDYWKANRTIEKTARKYLSVMDQAAAGVEKIQVQEFDIKDAIPWLKRLMKKAIPTSWEEASMARGAVSKQIKDYLLKKLGGESFINIKGRNYNAKDYAELVARTRMRESQMEAVKESMKQFDEDLVEIPRHDNPCEEICAEYQGQVYSISGETPGYELLPDGGPPWHP